MSAWHVADTSAAFDSRLADDVVPHTTYSALPKPQSSVLAAPQANPVSPMTVKSNVIALEMPAAPTGSNRNRTQEDGQAEHRSEMATQPMRPPTPTITQR